MYGVVAACLSFWLPALVMVYVYIRVYMEAVRLEAQHEEPVVSNLLAAQDASLPLSMSGGSNRRLRAAETNHATCWVSLSVDCLCKVDA